MYQFRSHSYLNWGNTKANWDFVASSKENRSNSARSWYPFGAVTCSDWFAKAPKWGGNIAVADANAPLYCDWPDALLLTVAADETKLPAPSPTIRSPWSPGPAMCSHCSLQVGHKDWTVGSSEHWLTPVASKKPSQCDRGGPLMLFSITIPYMVCSLTTYGNRLCYGFAKGPTGGIGWVCYIFLGH